MLPYAALIGGLLGLATLWHIFLGEFIAAQVGLFTSFAGWAP